MKAIVVHAANDVRIETRDRPSPGQGQVLIKMAAGGICGSDLHYVQHGGFGTVRLREPMILGHEVSGHVEALGPDTTGFETGELVAISPSRPCRACRFCHEGTPQHCLNMRFYGSAMPFPHIQGAFSQWVVADIEQCVPAHGLSAGEAAMAEPLSVCLHGAKQAGDLMGKRVLITGCGPIGLLCVLVAKAAGAAEIVATDITEFTLSKAREIGATKTFNMLETPDALDVFSANKGHFDVLLECSGAEAALRAAIPALRPRSTIVQLGLGGDMTLPLQAMTAKELSLRGSFRFHEEFATAIRLMQNGTIIVQPLITQTIPLGDAVSAFNIAADRNSAIKALIAFA